MPDPTTAPHWPVQLATLRIEDQREPYGRAELRMLIGCDARRDPNTNEWVATDGEWYRGTGLTAPEAVLECLRNHALGRAPLPVDPAMRVIKRCKLCDTIETFEIAGSTMTFAPHRDDPDFCRDMTIGRIQTFERVIAQQGADVARAQLEAREDHQRLRDIRNDAIAALADDGDDMAIALVTAIASGAR